MYTFHHYCLTSHIAHRSGYDSYLAYPVNEPEQRVILKIFDPAYLLPGVSPQDVQQMGQRLQLLKHPGIVAVRELDIQQGQPYVVSAYLEGSSLRQYLGQPFFERLSVDDAIGIVSQVGQALVFAHTYGIVHQHIRPENIMLNEKKAILLTDFSLSTIIAETRIEDKSDEHVLSYLAPEQLAGEASPSSDQYALGCLLYELVTGTLPFKVDDHSSLLQRLALTTPVAPTKLVPTLSHRIETVLLRAMEVRPQERYSDVATFLTELKASAQPEAPAFPFAHLTAGRQGGGSRPGDKKIRMPSRLFVPHEGLGEPEIPASDTYPSSLFFSGAEAQSPSIPELATDVDQKENVSQNNELSSLMVANRLENIFQDDELSSLLAAHQLGNVSQNNELSSLMVANRLENIFQDAVLSSPLVAQRKGDVFQADDELSSATDVVEDFPLLEERNIFVTDLPTEVLLPISSEDNLSYQQTQPVMHHDIITPQAATSDVVLPFRAQTPAARRSLLVLARKRSWLMIAVALILVVVVFTQVLNSAMIHVVNNVFASAKAPTASTKVTSISTSSSTTPSTPIAAMNVNTSYEAESPRNTRAANLQEFSCSFCSGGFRIGGIVGSATLQFNDVISARTKSYTLLVYYYNSVPEQVTELFVGVDGYARVEMTGLQVATTHCCNYAPSVVSMAITLQAGNNTILLSDPNGPAPDIDRIAVEP